MHESPHKPRAMGFDLPIGNDVLSARRRIEAMEQLLENSFSIPGVNYRIGLDSIVGLVPVVGDVVTAAMGMWLVWEAKNLGMPKWKLWRMTGNVALDTAVGAVPLIGDAADFMFRSTTRNLRIVKRHLDKHHPATRTIDG
ncbi:DUF4112 domain-containing protein [Altererythrobacter aerius]|uniref:DUF4112 domain-containing protein n=1 Tax=Tsuneonella aeria TaxID=1837929 RepID=A0A6I4TDG2_9SPHN|nr:DUF4112 domain-containing protein [Tsuneonella aeria]MXO75629.1 DUF4112 domain-containing protein [Tsuneonella aeria]